MPELEKALAAAAEHETSWRDKIFMIETKITAAQQIVTVADDDHRANALAASLEDAKAVAAIAAARKRQDGARRDLADLGLALNEARQRLAKAVEATSAAQSVLDKAFVADLARKRVAAAAAFDDAAAAMSKAYAEWHRLGDEIQQRGDARFIGPLAVSSSENAFGSGRLLMAMPGFMRKLFFTAPWPPAEAPLGVSETHLWNLAAIVRTAA